MKIYQMRNSFFPDTTYSLIYLSFQISWGSVIYYLSAAFFLTKSIFKAVTVGQLKDLTYGPVSFMPDEDYS